MIGEKYDKKEKINQFKEQAFEYLVNKLQSSQENIKELLFDQFGLTDKKISEYAKISNGKLDEISNQNIYIIQQLRAMKKFITSVSNVSEKQTIHEKSSSVKSMPTSNKNEGEHSQSSHQPHVENRAIERSENWGLPVLFGGHNLSSLVEVELTDLPKCGCAMAPPVTSGTSGLENNVQDITEPPQPILGMQDHHNGSHITGRLPLPPLCSGLQNLDKTAVKLYSSKLTKLEIDKKIF